MREDDQIGRREWSECWPRAVTHHPEKKSHSCGHMCAYLLELFSPVGRVGRRDSNGGLSIEKSRRKSFPAVEVI